MFVKELSIRTTVSHTLLKDNISHTLLTTTSHHSPHSQCSVSMSVYFNIRSLPSISTSDTLRLFQHQIPSVYFNIRYPPSIQTPDTLCLYQHQLPSVFFNVRYSQSIPTSVILRLFQLNLYFNVNIQTSTDSVSVKAQYVAV